MTKYTKWIPLFDYTGFEGPLSFTRDFCLVHGRMNLKTGLITFKTTKDKVLDPNMKFHLDSNIQFEKLLKEGNQK